MASSDNPRSVEPDDLPLKAKLAVLHNYNVYGIGTSRGKVIEPLTLEDVYVVWFAYILGNWKALVSTTKMDERYYEVTYDRSRDVMFVDTYVKSHNTVIEGGVF